MMDCPPRSAPTLTTRPDEHAPEEACSPCNYKDYTPLSYRDAATTLWGEAGTYACAAYDRFRPLYPDVPASLPIVIGLTAYGHCIGLTRTHWVYGPRITLHSNLFARGRRHVDDVMVHEMLHVWLYLTGQDTDHDSVQRYAAIQRLSPAVLGHAIDVRRGADRRSVRIPNPRAGEPGEPKTLVRKVRTAALAHDVVAGWPQSFRPAKYDWGARLPCPSY